MEEGEEEVEDREVDGVAEAEVEVSEAEEEEGEEVVDLIIEVEEGVGEGLEEVEGDGTDSLNWSNSRLIVSPILGDSHCLCRFLPSLPWQAPIHPV